MLTTVVTSPIAGALFDRSPRVRRTLVVVETVRAVNAAVVVALVATEHISVAAIVVASIVEGAAGAAFIPARSLAIRAVVPADRLSAALSQDESRGHVAGLIGPPLGGILWTAGRSFPFLADCLSYAASAVILALGKLPVLGVPGETGAEGAVAPPLRGVFHGVQLVWRDTQIRVVVVFASLLNLALAGGSVIVIVLSSQNGSPPWVAGATLSIAGLAGILGSFLPTPLLRSRAPIAILAAIAWAWGVVFCCASIPGGAWILMAAIAVVGVLSPTVNVAAVQTLMLRTPAQLQGRVFAAYGAVALAIGSLGPLLAGIAAAVWSARFSAAVFGGYLFVVALGATAVWLVRRNSTAERQTAKRAE